MVGRAVNRKLFCIACTLFPKVLVYCIALTGYRQIRLWLGGRAKREGNETTGGGRGRGARAGKLLGRRDRIINVVRLYYKYMNWRVAPLWCPSHTIHTRICRYVHCYSNAIINKANRSPSLSFSHLVTCLARAEPIWFINRHEFTCRLQSVAWEGAHMLTPWNAIAIARSFD